MEQPEIESNHLDAVKNLRSKFEQLAHNEPRLVVPEPTTPTKSTTATTARRPPPPPPSSSSRAPSPAPSISPRASPLLRPVSTSALLSSPNLGLRPPPVPGVSVHLTGSSVGDDNEDDEVQKTPTVAALRNRFMLNQQTSPSPSSSPLPSPMTSPSSSAKAKGVGKLNLHPNGLPLHHAFSDSNVPTQTHPSSHPPKPPVPSRPSKLTAVSHPASTPTSLSPSSPAPLIDLVTSPEDTVLRNISTRASRSSLGSSNNNDDPFGDSSDSASSVESPTTTTKPKPKLPSRDSKGKPPALPARKGPATATPPNGSTTSLNITIGGHRPSLSSSSSSSSGVGEAGAVFSPVPSASSSAFSSRSSSSFLPPPPRHPETPTLSTPLSLLGNASSTSLASASSSTSTPPSSSTATPNSATMSPPTLPTRPKLPARRATATQLEDLVGAPKLPRRSGSDELVEGVGGGAGGRGAPPPPPLATHPSNLGLGSGSASTSALLGSAIEDKERKPLGSGTAKTLLPPPTRTIGLGDKLPPARRAVQDKGKERERDGDDGDGENGGQEDSDDDEYDDEDEDGEGGHAIKAGGPSGSILGGVGKGPGGGLLDNLPDSTNSSRRPPWIPGLGPSPSLGAFGGAGAAWAGTGGGVGKIHAPAYTNSTVLVGNLVVVGYGHHVKVWELGNDSSSPKWEMDTVTLGKGWKNVVGGGAGVEVRGRGPVQGQGPYIWIALKEGHIFELDLGSFPCRITGMRHNAHMNPIVYLARYGDAMVSVDEGGKVLIWGEPVSPHHHVHGGGAGALLNTTPRVMRITEKLDFCKLVGGGCLWTAGRSEVSIVGGVAGAVGNGTGTGGGGSGSGGGGIGGKKAPVIRVYEVFPSSETSATKAGGAGGGLVPGPVGVGKTVIPPDHVGPVTCATVVCTKEGYVYMGHEGGSISVWDVGASSSEPGSYANPKCIDIFKISSSDIISMEGVSSRLWVGARNGAITAYDPSSKPWVATNSWVAHPTLPVLKLAVDPFGINTIGRLAVLSVGRDERIGVWDGLLGGDWVDGELVRRESEFARTRDMKVLILSWNCDSAKPESLDSSPNKANMDFLQDVLKSADSPDIISFGLQEVIDLESRKMTAKNVVFGNREGKDKSSSFVPGYVINSSHHVHAFEESSQGAILGLSDKVTGAYRRWYDALTLAIKLAMPPEEPYSVVYTQSMVGLFSCVFIKHRERSWLRDLAITTVKRGMGGRYGNKGGIISRFILQDTSLCFINCHLAAGQHAVRARNSDIASMLEERQLFPMALEPVAYVGGGDGSMVLDHEMVFVNGDMNYRIDQRRDAIIAAVRAGEYESLLPHDQLLKEIKYNRGCRLRSFSEGPITFAPTYKYDRRSDTYDSSEKRRAPAWCDRVLWRSRVPERVVQEQYRRWEVNVSDHRPVSAVFRMTVKSVRKEVRERVKEEVKLQWVEESSRWLEGARGFYEGQMRL